MNEITFYNCRNCHQLHVKIYPDTYSYQWIKLYQSCCWSVFCGFNNQRFMQDDHNAAVGERGKGQEGRQDKQQLKIPLIISQHNPACEVAPDDFKWPTQAGPVG